MSFGQLVLRKIIKIVATRCQILRLKCTKYDFGRWGNLERSPGHFDWISGGLLLREGREKGRGGSRREGKGGKSRRGEGRG